MSTQWIPFLRAEFPPEVSRPIAEVLSSGYVGAGDTVDQLERALSTYLGADSVVCTCNCTAALTLAYVAAGVRPGTDVVSTPMTCSATNIALLQLGARIHWIDIDAMTGNVTPATVAEALDRAGTASVVVAMDWGGTPCDHAGIADVCNSYGVKYVLDAAQSFGSTHAGLPLSPFPDLVCYSFGPTKIFSSIEGGAVVARDRDTIARLRRMRWYGIERRHRDPLRFWEYEVNDPGFRFVSNNVFAAVGLHMLKRLGQRLEHHRILAYEYDRIIAPIDGIAHSGRPDGSQPSFWLYTTLAERRSRLMHRLHESNVHAATPHIRNDRLLAHLPGVVARGDLPGLDAFEKQYLCLPIGSWISTADVERIGQIIDTGW